jgi:phosphopantetheine adenylyltransferase
MEDFRLLDETSPTIQQQQFSETIIPQKNIPSIDLLSNLDDNLMTNVPTEANTPLTLLEEEKKEQEYPLTEIDSDNGNILKDDDKEVKVEVEETEEEEEQVNDGIYYIRAAFPNFNFNDMQKQFSANQGNDIQSEEAGEEKENDNKQEEQKQQKLPH